MFLINCCSYNKAVTFKNHNTYLLASIYIFFFTQFKNLSDYRILVAFHTAWHKCRIYYSKYILLHDTVGKFIICINIFNCKTLYCILITIFSSLNKILSCNFILSASCIFLLFSYRKHNNPTKRKSCKCNLFVLNRKLPYLILNIRIKIRRLKILSTVQIFKIIHNILKIEYKRNSRL